MPYFPSLGPLHCPGHRSVCRHGLLLHHFDFLLAFFRVSPQALPAARFVRRSSSGPTSRQRLHHSGEGSSNRLALSLPRGGKSSRMMVRNRGYLPSTNLKPTRVLRLSPGIYGYRPPARPPSIFPSERRYPFEEDRLSR